MESEIDSRLDRITLWLWTWKNRNMIFIRKKKDYFDVRFRVEKQLIEGISETKFIECVIDNGF